MAVVVYHITTIESRVAGGYSVLSWVGNLGKLGVELFFVISGFIMITTNWEQFGKAGAPGGFLLRRIVRIAPPYWIVSALLLVVFLVNPHWINSSSRYPTDLIASFLLLPQRGYPLLMVGWTLVFEMYFYYVFTLALATARRSAPLVIGSWLIAMIVVRQTLYPHTSNIYVWLVCNPSNLFFIAGIVAGYLVMSRRFHAPMLCAVLGGLATPVVFYAVENGFGWRGYLSDWVNVLLVSLPMAAMLYGLVVAEMNRAFRVAAPLVLTGDASYSLYLWHVPILAAVGRASTRLPLHPLAAHLAWCTLALVFTTLCAIALYRYVEKPMLKALDARLRLWRLAVVVR